nr:MAG TPA: hypothetical protein [Caudoviricetes sp.]
MQNSQSVNYLYHWDECLAYLHVPYTLLLALYYRLDHGGNNSTGELKYRQKKKLTNRLTLSI